MAQRRRMGRRPMHDGERQGRRRQLRGRPRSGLRCRQQRRAHTGTEDVSGEGVDNGFREAAGGSRFQEAEMGRTRDAEVGEDDVGGGGGDDNG
jgi:hypothetical protein